MASDSGIVIAASYWGKFKTVFQMAMIIVLIADFGGVFDLIGEILVWIALALTVISLIDIYGRTARCSHTAGCNVAVTITVNSSARAIRKTALRAYCGLPPLFYSLTGAQLI